MKIKPIAAVRPNAGIEAMYQRKLRALLDEMFASLIYWIGAAYRGQQDKMAADASPAMALRQVMRQLARRWTKKFDEAIPSLASYFSTAMADRTDAALRSALKKAGVAVEWKMTREMNNVLQATIGEQVSLITNLSQQALSNVEGLVMRAVATGGDLQYLTQQLKERHGIESRRAARIARDQTNKANSVMTRVRQAENGYMAVWKHSHASKEPRPEHLKWDGKEYDPAIGMWSDEEGRYVWPGELINCHCFSKTVPPWKQVGRAA